MEPCKDAVAYELYLISRCKAGEKEQFHALITPYLQTIALFVYSILQNHEDTEEIVQETVLKAFTHLEQLRDGESFKAWLLQIAANEARMRLRQRRAHQFDSVEGQIQEREFQPRQFVEWRNIPSHELEQKELRAALISAWNGLSEGNRAVFVLRDVHHLSSAQTAKILDLSESAVDTRLHRARLQMRELLSSFLQRPTRRWIPISFRMMALMGKTMLRRVISCRRVMRELSNYIDSCIAAELRQAIDDHLCLCERCSIVLDTTRKTLYLVGDEKVFDLPFKCTQGWEQLVRKAQASAAPPSQSTGRKHAGA